MNKTNASPRSGLMVLCLFAAMLAAVVVAPLTALVRDDATHPHFPSVQQDVAVATRQPAPTVRAQALFITA